MGSINIKISGNIAFSNLFQNLVEDFSKCAGMTVKSAEAFGLAGREIFINAVKHGCKMDPSKKIKIRLGIRKDTVELSVTDPGNGFDAENIKDPTTPENRLKVKGRGLLIMKSYSDKAFFKRLKNGKGMQVKIIKKIPLAKGKCTN